MSVIEQLSSSLGRRDEVPNQQLASRIVQEKYLGSIRELAENLENKNKNIQHDCIKVLYEIAAAEPGLISPYCPQLLQLLKSKDNRLQWGAMTALGAITLLIPQVISEYLPELEAIADKGSVITKDNFVAILIRLASITAYNDVTTTLLLEQLNKSLPNQLPMYAENALPVISKAYQNVFMDILTSRLPDIEKESKRKRIEKVIKKLS